MGNDILARLSVQIDAQTAQFGAALRLLEQQTNKFGGAIKAQTTTLSNFEKRVASIQRGLGSLGVAFGAFQIASIVQNSIRTIADFEQQIATVSAIAGATGNELNQLREDALRLGAATKFTATEVAQLQTEFGRLGFSTEEILAATEATLELATATGEDLARSADVAGSTVRAFGLSADETLRVVDVMALSFNKSALSLDNFAESMKFVAPIAASANISVEETTALLGVLADAGIRGSQAGTGLRRIITDLAKDGRPLADRLKELADKGLTFGGAMDEVGRFAQSALLVLTKNVSKVNEATESYNNAAGAAKATADIMRDTLTGDVEKLTSAWDGFILSLDKGDGSLREAVQAITQLVNAITRISNSEFGEFVADWFKLTQTVPRLVLGAIDLFSEWGDEIKITREEAGKLYGALLQAQSAARFEGDTEGVTTLQSKIDQLKQSFSDLGKEAGIVGPQISTALTPDPALLALLNNNLSESTGIVAGLEKKIKDLGEAIKAATSVADIRRLQHELEGAQIKLNALLNPSIAPKPIEIPFVIDTESSRQDFIDQVLAFSNELSAANPDGIIIPAKVEFLEETSDEWKERMKQMEADVEGFAVDLSGIVSGAVIGLAEAAGNAFTGAGDFGKDILKVVASFAKQFGELMVGAGFAALGLKQLIKNPLTAILAGSALIALASAVTATANRQVSAIGSGGGGGGVGGGGATQGVRTPDDLGRNAIRFEFGTTEFKFNGRELVAAIKDQEFRSNG